MAAAHAPPAARGSARPRCGSGARRVARGGEMSSWYWSPPAQTRSRRRSPGSRPAAPTNTSSSTRSGIRRRALGPYSSPAPAAHRDPGRAWARPRERRRLALRRPAQLLDPRLQRTHTIDQPRVLGPQAHVLRPQPHPPAVTITPSPAAAAHAPSGALHSTARATTHRRQIRPRRSITLRANSVPGARTTPQGHTRRSPRSPPARCAPGRGSPARRAPAPRGKAQRGDVLLELVVVSSNDMKTPGAPRSRAPRTRNSAASSVLPVPGPPHTSVVRPSGSPPPVISSRPRIPVGAFVNPRTASRVESCSWPSHPRSHCQCYPATVLAPTIPRSDAAGRDGPVSRQAGWVVTAGAASAMKRDDVVRGRCRRTTAR